MRKVEIYEWQADHDNRGSNKRVKVCEGFFHQWGVDYAEFENNAGNFSTAIIETNNGTIENIPANLIRFIDKPASVTPVLFTNSKGEQRLITIDNEGKVDPLRFTNAIGEPIKSTFDDNAR